MRGISLIIGIFLLLTNLESYGATPQKVKVSNIRDTQFTISWITDVPEIGRVNYGTYSALGETGYDDEGSQSLSSIHYVTIIKLTPQTTYFYQIISGTLTMEMSSVTTGISILPVGSDVAYGQVFKEPGNPLNKGGICYLRLKDIDGLDSKGDSQLVSTLVDENGYWSMELVNIREANLKNLFKYSNVMDKLYIYVEGGNEGNSEQIVSTYDDSPAPDIILGR
ncbi:MAG: fibronectin type III domain-containing protein [bacterium]